MAAIAGLCATGLTACAPELPPVGHTWSVDLSQTEWVEPENIATLVALYGNDYPFFVSTQAIDSPKVDMLFVLGDDDGQQDTCSRTITMNGVRFKKNGDFEIGPLDFGLANGLNTQQLIMKGNMSEDMTTLNNIELMGHVDLDSIPTDVFDPGDSTMCELVEVFEIPCSECPSGTGDCIYTHASNITANLVTDVAIERVAAPDCHESCAASADNPDCDL